MENIKEYEKMPYMRVQNVMKLMNCSKSVAYDRMKSVTVLLKNPRSIVGVQIKIDDFVGQYPDYTLEQCRRAIDETPIEIKPFKRK